MPLSSRVKSRASASRQRTPGMCDSTTPAHQAVPGSALLPSWSQGVTKQRGPVRLSSQLAYLLSAAASYSSSSAPVSSLRYLGRTMLMPLLISAATPAAGSLPPKTTMIIHMPLFPASDWWILCTRVHCMFSLSPVSPMTLAAAMLAAVTFLVEVMQTATPPFRRVTRAALAMPSSASRMVGAGPGFGKCHARATGVRMLAVWPMVPHPSRVTLPGDLQSAQVHCGSPCDCAGQLCSPLSACVDRAPVCAVTPPSWDPPRLTVMDPKGCSARIGATVVGLSDCADSFSTIAFTPGGATLPLSLFPLPCVALCGHARVSCLCLSTVIPVCV
jgi:hypothetical protein